MRTSPTLLLALLCFLVGCDEGAAVASPTVSAVERGPGPSEAEDPVGAALHRTVVARAGELEEVERTIDGTLETGLTHTHGIVLIGTYCYRIFAQGGAGLRELDLSLVGPDGVPMQRDRGEGASANLGLDDAICPYTTGAHQLSVRAAEGAGAYQVRLFREQVL